MRNFKFIIYAIVIVLFIIKIFPLTRINSKCVRYDEIVGMTISGTVVKKYIDSTQHSYKIVEIRSLKCSTVDKLNMDFDVNNFYDSIMVGDTLKKRLGSDSFFVKGSGDRMFIVQLNFGCVR